LAKERPTKPQHIPNPRSTEPAHCDFATKMPAAGGSVGKSKDDDLEDAYELLGVSEDADDKEIQGAFRKGSLKCHPDRNPDDPEAAEKFDKLQRAKELLLDPMRRADFDRLRKAKYEQEARAAEEDEKRRKLREDLEAREGIHAAAESKKTQAAAAEENRRKYAQMDFAARIKAKEAEKASKHAEAAAVASRVRQASEDAKVRLRWREKKSEATRKEAVKKAFQDLDLRAVSFDSELEGLAQFGSREDALRAVLACRANRQQLGFRALMLETETSAAQVKRSSSNMSFDAEEKLPKKPSHGGGAGLKKTGSGHFDDWEADMLSSLRGLAKAQKAPAAS